MQKKKILESEITAKIIKYLRTLDKCFCWKEHGGMYGCAGIPDIICCFRGKFIAFEVKRPGNAPTKLQDETISKINIAEGQAFVVHSVDEVKIIVEKNNAL